MHELRRLLSRVPQFPVQYADHVEESGTVLFKVVCEMDHIRFTKPCLEISESLCVADQGKVAFQCLGVKKEVGKVKVIE
jgi:hypothetical protein